MTVWRWRPAGGVARAAAAAQARACAGRGTQGRRRLRPRRRLKESRGRGSAPGAADPPRSMRKMLLAALSRVLQGPAAAGRTVSAAAERGRCRPGRCRCAPRRVRCGRGARGTGGAGNSPTAAWLRGLKTGKTEEKLKKKRNSVVFLSPTLRDDPE